MQDTLCVSVKNTRVGTLKQMANKEVQFEFTQAYLAQDESKPILSLSQAALIDQRVTLPLSHNLPLFFAQLLPSGDYYKWLCDLFAIYPEDTFLFLSIYGGNLFGSVQVLAECSEDTCDVNMLDDIRLGKFPNAWQYMALPGNHTKLPILQEDDHFLLARNPLQAPFYLQLANDNEPFFVDNIYLMSHLANAVGLATPTCLKANDITLPKDIPGLQEQTMLVMSRIDRDSVSGVAIHAETMAQAMGVAGVDLTGVLDVADMLQFVQSHFAEPKAALRVVIEQVVFHLLVGNACADLNRFAILYSDDNVPHISPLLQPMSTLLYAKTSQLALSINNAQAFDVITLEDFQALSEQCELDEKEIKKIVLNIMQQASDTWPSVISNIAVPTPLYDALHQHWEVIAKHF